MAFKVLLGLLAVVAVTGSAVFYSHTTVDCPLAGTCPSQVQATLAETDECPACASCAAKSKAKPVCCADGEESAAGGDAMAAATGGVSLGR